MKENEKERFGSMPLNLQFFAEDNNEDEEDDDVIDGEGSDTGEEGDKDSDAKDNKKQENKKSKTFTQEQVTRMMTKEKNQGRNAAYKELGINPKDPKMVAMVKALIESQKSDDQKAKEKEDAENERVSELEQRALVAEVKAEAMQLGVKTQFVEDIVSLVLAKLSDDADAKTLIGEYKTKYPMWFGIDDNEDEKEKERKKGQKGTGSSVKVGKEDKKSEKKSLGARLAAQRNTVTKKSSYWD